MLTSVYAITLAVGVLLGDSTQRLCALAVALVLLGHHLARSRVPAGRHGARPVQR